QAVAFQVVPSAQHFDGDTEILGDGFDRIAFAYFVMGGGMGVGAGIAIARFAGSDGDDETGFGRERFTSRIDVEVVGFGDGLWSGVIGAGDGSQRLSTLHLVITPP